MRVQNMIYIMNCFRRLLDYTATCTQTSLFLGKSLVMIQNNSQTVAGLSLTRNPYMVYILSSVFPNSALIVRNPWLP